MADFSKLKLSGSTNGRGIKLVPTATPGTLLHTAVPELTSYDEIWLYMTNNHTADVAVTIEFGGTTNPDDRIQMTIPSKTGLYLVVPGLILTNSLIVRAYAATANVISVHGFVNRIVG